MGQVTSKVQWDMKATQGNSGWDLKSGPWHVSQLMQGGWYLC